MVRPGWNQHRELHGHNRGRVRSESLSLTLSPPP